MTSNEHKLNESDRFSNQNIHSKDYEDIVSTHLTGLLEQAKVNFNVFLDEGGGLKYKDNYLKGVDILYEFNEEGELQKAQKILSSRFNTQISKYNDNCIAFNLKRVSNSANYPYAHGGDISTSIKNKLIKKDVKLYRNGIKPTDVFFANMDDKKVRHDLKERLSKTLCVNLTKELFFDLFYKEILDYFVKQEGINWVIFINNHQMRNKFKVVNPSFFMEKLQVEKDDIKVYKSKDFAATYLVKINDLRVFWVGNVHRGFSDKRFNKVEWKIANELLLSVF